MEIKLIASDLDDTLLNSDTQISDRNAAVIRAALEKGIIFLIATGRMYISAVKFAERLGLDVPLVTYNGALVKENISGRVLYENRLNYDTAKEILDYCKANHRYVQVYVGDEILVAEKGYWTEMYEKISGIKIRIAGDEAFNIKEAPYKLLAISEEGHFEEMWQEFEEKFGDKIDITSSKDNFLELMEPGINKWDAVKAVAAQYGIKPEEIMCIGDSNNDMKMIANAGLGVAIGNAKDKVKDCAKIITASNDEDGVALVIEQILTQQVQVPEE